MGEARGGGFNGNKQPFLTFWHVVQLVVPLGLLEMSPKCPNVPVSCMVLNAMHCLYEFLGFK